MGAHWKTAMREAGFNPKIVQDAPQRLGIVEATVGVRDMRGAVIGDGENCSGARCLRRVLKSVLEERGLYEDDDDLFIFVGASRAIVAWRNKRGRPYGYRFLVNGLPKAQDRTMNIAGERIALRPPYGKRLTGKRQGGPSPKRGRRTGTHSVTRSLAAELRARS
jgi:hypothetical protein